jgi:hypothetical protein
MKRWRLTLALLVAMLLASFVLLLALENLGPRGEALAGLAPNSVLALERAPDAKTFDSLLRRYWVAPRATPAQTEAGTPEAPIPRLRWSLVIDSLLLVPAYAGLLVAGFIVFMRRLRPPRPGRIELRLHLLCVLPALAAVFDVAENGMLVRAAEDALAGLLADATVADLRDASRLKWSCIALASALAGIVSIAAWQREPALPRRWTLLVAAGLGFAALALLLPGLPWHRPALVLPGVLAFGALLLVTAHHAWILCGAAAMPPHASQHGAVQAH